jgi:hypothetical protein
MTELIVLISDALPTRYEGASHGFAVQPLGVPHKIAIEDYFDKRNQRTTFPASAFVIRMPAAGERVAQNNPSILLAEFALTLLATGGHPKLSFASLFRKGKCIDCTQLPSALWSFATPQFVSRINEDAAAQWVCRCSMAHKTNGDRIDIAARRFVRFSRFVDPADALLDLCISLESLLNSQTEVSFRFGLSLAKLIGLNGAGAQSTAELLGNLYKLRSKLAHGDPGAHKLLSQMQADLPKIRKIAREILVRYVLYLGDHSRREWDEHLETCIYS